MERRVPARSVLKDAWPRLTSLASRARGDYASVSAWPEYPSPFVHVLVDRSSTEENSTQARRGGRCLAGMADSYTERVSPGPRQGGWQGGMVRLARPPAAAINS